MAGLLALRTSMRLLGLREALSCSINTSAADLVKRPIFEGPLPPKRPASEFAIFVKTNMASLPTELNIREKMQRLGQMWKNCPTTEKSSYHEQYLKLKKEHEQKLEQFMADLGPKKDDYLKQLSVYKHKKHDFRQAVRDKRKGIQGTNMSGYTLYLQDNFAASLANHGGGRENVPVVMKELASRWKELDEETKLSYKTRATTINSERKLKNETLGEKKVKPEATNEKRTVAKNALADASKKTPADKKAGAKTVARATTSATKKAAEKAKN